MSQPQKRRSKKDRINNKVLLDSLRTSRCKLQTVTANINFFVRSWSPETRLNQTVPSYENRLHIKKFPSIKQTTSEILFLIKSLSINLVQNDIKEHVTYLTTDGLIIISTVECRITLFRHMYIPAHSPALRRESWKIYTKHLCSIPVFENTWKFQNR